MAVSKRIRFEVFKRDLFACQYCGSTPPAIVLELDHIHPISKGGSDGKENLLTSCMECNRGKSDKLLSVVPQTVIAQSEILAEKLEQVKALHRLQKSIRRHEDKCIQDVGDIFELAFPGYQFNDRFRESCRKFVQQIPLEVLRNNMDYACFKMRHDMGRAIKYFCGICWRQIKGAG